MGVEIDVSGATINADQLPVAPRGPLRDNKTFEDVYSDPNSVYYQGWVASQTTKPPPYPGEGIAEVPASRMNRSARKPSQTQQTVAGQNSLLPLLYGRARLGPKITGMIVYKNKLILRCEWCLGEVDAIESVQVDDADVPNGIDFTHYTGTQTQPVDPTLAQAFAADGKVYSDRLLGICYSVASVTPAKSRGFPRLNAVIRGMKIRTGQNSVRIFNDNPAYVMADFIESNTYGMGRLVDWSSVADVAAACDVQVGGERKRIIALALDTSDTGENWLQVLRDYAGCWVVPEQGRYRLIPDIAGNPVAAFDASNIVARSLRLGKRGSMNSETVVQVDYTDTTQSPWRTESVYQYAPGVTQGTTAFRLSRVARPGTTRYSEAARCAIERLNTALICDLSVAFVTFDQALALRVGDIIMVTHPVGITAKQFRVIAVEPVQPGRWQVSGVEYDPAKYSSAVVTGPSVPDTLLPSALTPPIPAGLAVEEEIYQSDNGLWASRLVISWNDMSEDYPFVAEYVVNVVQDGLIKDGAVVANATQHVTKPLAEAKTYAINVATRSNLGILSGFATASIATVGKLARPSDVRRIDGYEVGGEVRLEWDPAVDLDLTAHEIRYGSTAGSWSSATLLDRIAAPGIRYETKTVPAGTWRFWIKGLDSIRTADFPFGQESINPVYCDITVTSDANAFLAGKHEFTGLPTLTNMIALTDWKGDAYWVSDNGTSWNSLFTTALSNYPNPALSYPGGFTSTFETDHHDFGAAVTGTWTGAIPFVNIYGSAPALHLDLSLTDSGYDDNSPGVSATAQWAKMRAVSSGTLRVTGKGEVRVVAVGRTETGTIHTSDSGPATVTLTSRYFKAVSIQITAATGATPRVATYDNVVVGLDQTNTFDAYAFDLLTGNKDDVDCTYTFVGV